jgi:hypothetical protein
MKLGKTFASVSFAGAVPPATAVWPEAAGSPALDIEPRGR